MRIYVLLNTSYSSFPYMVIVQNTFDVVVNILKELNLSVVNRRGKTFDNAGNMAGKLTGLQARVEEVNSLAECVPCAEHSLNLVGVAVAECCVNAVSFFGFIQTVYIYF